MVGLLPAALSSLSASSRVKDLDGWPGCPFGRSHNSATLRLTRSRACARRIDWRRMERRRCSVSVLSVVALSASQRSTSSAVSSASRRLPRIIMAGTLWNMDAYAASWQTLERQGAKLLQQRAIVRQLEAPLLECQSQPAVRRLPPLTLDGDEARDLVEALDLVAESDGDVRQMMSVLAEWRDRLRDRLLQ
jgi:hypothetical protein